MKLEIHIELEGLNEEANSLAKTNSENYKALAIMSWEKVQIGQLGEVITGNTPPRMNPEFYGEFLPFIKPTDIEIDRRYTSDPEECYSELAFEKYKKSLVPRGATCVVTIGSIGKKITQAISDCFINQAMNAVIPNKNFDNDFVFYLLKNNLLEEKQKLGVFWHTQGSGKSYSMAFMCQKIHRKFTGSYTFLIVTDRNELDTQIYGTFSGVGAVPMVKAGSKDSIKASSGENLKKLLGEDHRYIFSLIHKFNFEEEITKRDNLIVISDEATEPRAEGLQ